MTTTNHHGTVAPAVQPGYWLDVCDGREAAIAFVRAKDDEVDSVLLQYPILFLPEFHDAIRQLALNVSSDEPRQLVEYNARFLQAGMIAAQNSDPPGYARRLTSCALALAQDLRGDRITNLSRAAALIRQALGIFVEDGVDAGIALMNLAAVLTDLSDQVGPTPAAVQEAIEVGIQARNRLPQNGVHYAVGLANAAGDYQRLGTLGVDAATNFAESLRLCAEAQARLNDEGVNFVKSLLTQAIATAALAELEVQPRENYQQALRIYRRVRRLARNWGAIYAQSLAHEGWARVAMARASLDPRKNLEKAAELLAQAVPRFARNSPDLPRTVLNQGVVEGELGELVDQPSDRLTYLHAALAYYSTAEGMFAPAPALSEEIRRYRAPVSTTWLVDETYVKVLGNWHYLYRGVDRDGQVLDCWLSRTRDLAAAEAFFRRTINSTGCMPEHVVTDKATFYPSASRACVPSARHTATGFYNLVISTNRCERNHGYVKSRVRPMRGLKSFKCATRLFRALDALQLVERDFVRVPPIGVPCTGGRNYVRARHIAAVITRLGRTL